MPIDFRFSLPHEETHRVHPHPLRALVSASYAAALGAGLLVGAGTSTATAAAPAQEAAAESVDGEADTWDQPLRGAFNQLRELKQRHPDLKVLWSFGGWTWSGGFGEAAKDPAAFARSCYGLVENSKWADVFDGVDIDWEYPNACGATCDTSGRDSFRTLMSALRTKFGSGNLVTAAITADATATARSTRRTTPEPPRTSTGTTR